MGHVSFSNRIKNSLEILELKNFGESFSDSNAVLIVRPNDLGYSRYAVIASRAVGGAVNRNRCKRRLRSRMDKMLKALESGYDFLVISRSALLDATPAELDQSIRTLFERAGLLKNEHIRSAGGSNLS